METSNYTQSNYIEYHNTVQLTLPLNVDILIDEDDKLVSFLEAIEGVNMFRYLRKRSRRGRKGHKRVNLLKAVLFGRMVDRVKTRELEEACRNDIRFMYLVEHETPSHMAFERLMNNYLIYEIDDIFFDLSLNIGEKMEIDRSVQYIDGTKFEADANRYSFVYKKRITNSRRRLYSRITDSIILMNTERGFSFSYGHFYCAQEMGYILQYLMEQMVFSEVQIVYGKGKRKNILQKWYDQFMEYYMKLMEYEFWLDIIGEERNSCSKTDHDATMMAMKIDYYCQTGLSRPGYNAQIAVSDGIIVNAELYQRAGDTQTFIPFMERYHEHTGEYPECPMADAGYGSYDNYMYCLTNGMKLVMKYSMYARKNDPEFQKKRFSPQNWKTDEEGNRICPYGRIFSVHEGTSYDETGRYLKIKDYYGCGKSCEGCRYMEECCRTKSGVKILTRDEVLNQFYDEVDQNLSDDYGKELKKQRSIQVEGAFGVIKQDMKFTRFTRRGLKNAKMEFLIVCIGYNLIKYHRYRLKKKKENRQNSVN